MPVSLCFVRCGAWFLNSYLSGPDARIFFFLGDDALGDDVEQITHWNCCRALLGHPSSFSMVDGFNDWGEEMGSRH